MKRRDFFRKGAKGALAASAVPLAVNLPGSLEEKGNREKDKWLQMGTGKMGKPDRKKEVKYDVVVIGGGMAGICAAVAAARNGSKTVLVQDRPVLGGNGSSEIRVHVNGVNHLRPDAMPERETGIIEEILLHNRFYNPQESYPVWDHVLYDFVVQEPNLDLMLNTQATGAIMDGSRIRAARCWQLTTETEYIISAKQFIDSSGDGMLAATAGALYRTGREAASEFNEKYAPKEEDGWQMGASILLQGKDYGKPMPYHPPSYVIEFDGEKTHPKRKIKKYTDGFWWVELGSDFDIIADLEINRHKLMGYLHGVWDYIKNSGKFPESENYALDWVGSLPGRRESRRFIGDFILSERDLTEHHHFDDAVAYGGWSLDEHCPGGIENPGDPPSYFHEKFDEIYQIPFRSLYSKNVSNLLFAGRNISQTHIALSSSRVQATCALMGQAAGTAAALCVWKNVFPSDIARNHVDELQERLMRDDAFIPKRPAKDAEDLARKANLIFASSTLTGNAVLLNNGWSRDIDGMTNHWQSDGLPADVQMEWEKPVSISKVEIKCDTNLKKRILMRKDSQVSDKATNTVPVELLRSLELEGRVQGKWKKLGSTENNQRRLIKFTFDPVRVSSIRIRLKETYGAENGKLFEIRCYES